jgi:hypothetical protein
MTACILGQKLAPTNAMSWTAHSPSRNCNPLQSALKKAKALVTSVQISLRITAEIQCSTLVDELRLRCGPIRS